jgi:predicted ATP-grasp superfamily ATP-dependent carboligase
LRCLSFQGESSAEFKLDYRDEKYKLMEINIRPVVTEWLFVAAGINFPYITYLDLVDNRRTETKNYDQELYWIHNHWELANFVISLRSGNLDIKEFLAPYWKHKVFLYPFLEDPIHFSMEVYLNGRKVLGKTLKQIFS